MMVEKQHNGSWLVTDIINGYLVQRAYYGHSKREAIAEFKAELQREKIKGT